MHFRTESDEIKIRDSNTQRAVVSLLAFTHSETGRTTIFIPKPFECSIVELHAGGHVLQEHQNWKAYSK